MGSRGPRPLPASVLLARGSWRGKAAMRGIHHALTLDCSRPACPEWLCSDAKKFWRRLIPQLEAMGLLARIDREPLARYCHAWARWRRAEAFIERYGESYPIKDERGQVRCFMPFPEVAIAHKLGQTLLRLEQEFGLTPSARARLGRDIAAIVPMSRPPHAHRHPTTPGTSTASQSANGDAQQQQPPQQQQSPPQPMTFERYIEGGYAFNEPAS